ncbi:MAG: hypothetical protein PHZ14_09745, partial [Sulfuricella sp.]|nr:hypothetical protein [Sulfuricella sp.]
LPVLQVNSHSIDQKSGEIWTAQADLQPISFKSDRLLATQNWNWLVYHGGTNAPLYVDTGVAADSADPAAFYRLNPVCLVQALFLAIALQEILQLGHPRLGVMAYLGFVSQDLVDQLIFGLARRLIKLDLGVKRLDGGDQLTASLFDADQRVPIPLHGRFAHLPCQREQRLIIRDDLRRAHALA